MFKITKMPTILCPNCGSKITFKKDNVEIKDSEGEERGMGAALTTTFNLVNYCPKCGQEHYYQFSVTEYPIGVLEGEVFNIETSADEVESNVSVEIQIQ